LALIGLGSGALGLSTRFGVAHRNGRVDSRIAPFDPRRAYPMARPSSCPLPLSALVCVLAAVGLLALCQRSKALISSSSLTRRAHSRSVRMKSLLLFGGAIVDRWEEGLAGCGKTFRKPVIPSAGRNLALKIKALQDFSSPAVPRNDSLDEFFRSLLD